MKAKRYYVGFLLFASISAVGLFAAVETQNITIDQDLQIPGATLKPGTYTLAVEDRMRDRAIIRISNANTNQSFLLLGTPNPELPAAANGIVYFHSANQILRGWACQSCPATLEFVYPKAEAAKIVGDTGQSALAVDPVFDKLPANLSPDDMQVVTLWLLSPKRLDAGQRAAGLDAVKYSPSVLVRAARTASQLPGTASNIYFFALCGCLLLAIALSLKIAPLIRRRLCIR